LFELLWAQLCIMQQFGASAFLCGSALT